jgi:predicted  nucleic acid-binding Zn-ribbon protein
MSEDMKFYIGLGQWVFMAAVGFYAWLSNRQAATAEDVTKLATRVTTVEEQMRHLPDQAMVNELAGDMKAVKSELTAIKESIVPLARSMDRINDYLLNSK